MNKIIIILLLFLLNSCSVKKHESKTKQDINALKAQINIPITALKESNSFKKFYEKITETRLPLSNREIKKYIQFTNTISNSVTTDLIYDKLPSPISKNNTFFSKKKRYAFIKSRSNSDEYNDGISYEKGNYFYPIYKYKKDSVYCIIYIYQDFEDIVPAIKTQLNTYNKEGVILDTLLLDNRFHYELIYKKDFLIKKDLSIHIKEHIINYYDEYDDLIHKDSLPKTKIKSDSYRINDKGVFEKI